MLKSLDQRDTIAVVDFGSQYTWLLVRRFRELGYYAEMLPWQTSETYLYEPQVKAVVLSGGPNSVYEAEAPRIDVKKLVANKPVLGVCYGMQLLARELGGRVEASATREYGACQVYWEKDQPLMSETSQPVWMSHGDVVTQVPEGFFIWARSENGLISAMGKDRVMAVQFHPEVAHTKKGEEILLGFVRVAGLKPNWQTTDMLQLVSESLRQKPLQGKVLCALSGGVDSTVTAMLLKRELGDEALHLVFVDTGLMRKNEAKQVMEMYKSLGLSVQLVSAQDRFLTALKGVEEPEEKRKIIGRVFIEVFESLLPALKNVHYLAQGTLYPDVIESHHSQGQGVSKTIKTHHNVGGLPERMKLQVIEPLRWLFKDEVRAIGEALGLPHHFVHRHPFPGPGLAIRILGEVTPQALEILREADDIFIQSLKSQGLYDSVWQAFAVLLPVKTVGVQGDGRTYEQLLGLRAVTSFDGMTADWAELPYDFLKKVSRDITNQVRGINRVVYDVTSKPPATIEWE
jgi:GMP synthase (glutamine-hydrolysing)